MKKNSTTFMIIATSLGSVLEMYDFVIYAFFAPVIGSLFFPKSDHTAALIATFGVFALGYLARPLGGIFFGWITDKRGRRAGLLYSVSAMGLSILVMGLLPTYANIGIAAAWLLLICRIFQGLSVGGEFPVATTFLAEHADKKHRGFLSSWLFFGINMGIVLASLVGAALTRNLSHSAVHSYGWRIAFILGSLLAFASYFVRSKLLETDIFNDLKQQGGVSKAPLATSIHQEHKNLVIGFALISVMAAAISTVFLFMPSFLHEYLNISLSDALSMNTISLVIFTCLIPITAKISDKIGRRPMLILGSLLFALLSHVLYSNMVNTNSHGVILFCITILGVIDAMIVGPIAATLSELFGTKARSTGIGIAYNLSFAIFGGLAPMALTWLIGRHENLSAPAIYLMITAVVSLIAALFLKESANSHLGE